MGSRGSGKNKKNREKSKGSGSQKRNAQVRKKKCVRLSTQETTPDEMKIRRGIRRRAKHSGGEVTTKCKNVTPVDG